MDVAYAVGIFAIVNPIGGTSFFTTLTWGIPEKKSDAWRPRLSSRPW